MSPVGGITTKDGRICVTGGCPLGRRCLNICTKMLFCRTTRSQRYVKFVNVHMYIHISAKIIRICISFRQNFEKPNATKIAAIRKICETMYTNLQVHILTVLIFNLILRKIEKIEKLGMSKRILVLIFLFTSAYPEFRKNHFKFYKFHTIQSRFL